MNSTLVIDCPVSSNPIVRSFQVIKRLEFSIDASGNVVMTLPQTIAEKTGAKTCVFEPRAFSGFCETIAARNENNSHNGMATLGDAEDALVRTGFHCLDDGLCISIYWQMDAAATEGCSLSFSWDDLQPFLAFEENTREQRLQLAPVPDQGEIGLYDPAAPVVIRCRDLRHPDTKELAFSIEPDGTVAMTVPPIVTRTTGAVFCTIKPATFKAMCLQIESRGELGRRPNWIVLGDSPNEVVRAGYICRDDGLYFTANWTEDGEEVLTNEPEIVPWDDLQPLLRLGQLLFDDRQLPVPAFGLCQA